MTKEFHLVFLVGYSQLVVVIAVMSLTVVLAANHEGYSLTLEADIHHSRYQHHSVEYVFLLHHHCQEQSLSEGDQWSLKQNLKKLER